MWRVASVVILSTACSYDPEPTGVAPDGAGPGPDGEVAVFDVAHVRTVEEMAFAGTADLAIGPATIDTAALTISTSLPAGARFHAAPQDGGGPELAILEVRSLAIDGEVTVVGTRPLVIIAADTISITGELSATAEADLPGAGGASPGTGSGTGGDGLPAGDCDQGGGGAGFGEPGGAGGVHGCSGNTAPTAGAVYGTPELIVLEGGSGGGRGSQCGTGGAGGGALQLFAATSIAITGAITAGGGGGRGGRECSGGVWSAGGGGGSGGAIYLQAPEISGTGVVAANGGGGGGGSFNPTEGSSGSDGLPTAQIATGGPGINGAGDGGNGGAGTMAAQLGDSPNPGISNAGGAGGGVGRIVLAVPTSASVSVTSSPAYVRTP